MKPRPAPRQSEIANVGVRHDLIVTHSGSAENAGIGAGLFEGDVVRFNNGGSGVGALKAPLTRNRPTNSGTQRLVKTERIVKRSRGM